jgi:cytochrome c oxidase subunit II
MSRWLALLALALLPGCGQRQSALHPAADHAATLMSLFQLMLWVCGIAYLLVILFLGWSLVRRRAVAGTGEQGVRAALGVWIGLILFGLVILVLGSFLADRTLGAAPQQALRVRVTGHQWWWRIEYEAGRGRWIETANELHLPMGVPVALELRAADVIHSFWIPNLAGKMDMIPGRINSMTVTPGKIGWFRGQCAEFCGTQHANMALVAKVEQPGEFSRWLAHQAEPAAGNAAGRAIVEQGSCAVCHQIRGTGAQGRVGPDLTHLASRRTIAAGMAPLTRGSLRGWIIQPQAMKPGTSMPPSDLSPRDAEAVARYLETLR